ncbi:hypothetical protein [Blastopirellula marina]|uniref:Uncharacterized protein n=1 Tax=Blastopirellula marina TaxID=124 RepID=A0A2S8FD52_9BACT|nr:hypothetical protein [Blastopirellula marina]PQO30086.1 hypothetical protein C5Y98_21265 [Blastopirellula marina]PTL42524.1 hypothetical protein C5Y97_21275 [Blastopirellula marina]
MKTEPTAEEDFLLAAPPWIKLRGLGILIAVIAVVIGVPLSEMGELSSAQWQLVALHVGVAIAAFAAFVVGYGLQRRHLSRESGPLLLELSGNWSRVYSAWDHDALVVLGLVLLNLGITRYLEDLQTLTSPVGRVELNWIMTLPMLSAADSEQPNG